MSLIDFLPASGAGDARYGQLAASNVWTSSNAFNGSFSAASTFKFGSQSFSATGTISSTGGSVVLFTGGTGQTLSLPASPSTNQVFFIRNATSNAVTLSGNGANVDGAASVTLGGANFTVGTAVLWFDGTNWQSIAPSSHVGTVWTGLQQFNQQIGAAYLLSVASCIRFINSQTFSATGTIVGGSGTNIGTCVLFTGSSGQTLTLPSTANNGEFKVVKNGSANTLTLAPNTGQNIEGVAGPISLAAGAARQLLYNTTGTNWQIVGGYL